MKIKGIFVKVFLYTMLIVLSLIIVTVGLFLQQSITFYNSMRMQQLSESYQVLISRLSGIDTVDVPFIAQQFYDANQSFKFYIVDNTESILFSTTDITISDTVKIRKDFTLSIRNDDYIIHAVDNVANIDILEKLIPRVLMALLIILILGVLAALLFARQMTRPILKLASDTECMKALKPIEIGVYRQDEFGLLERNTHEMYERLKSTIEELENEIHHVRSLEEAQRNFFSAASHELKTPLAATSIILEGMLDDIGDYQNHKKYLRECIRLIDTQALLVSELLEIVNLDDSVMTTKMESLDISIIVEDAVELHRALANTKNQTISITLLKNAKCICDVTLLRKALSNVIANAVQNAPYDAEVRIWNELLDNYMYLYVLNTNTQIDSNLIPKLFDPFYRADNARSQTGVHSGLGLAIVRRSLEAMDARFSIENSGNGVLFTIILEIT